VTVTMSDPAYRRELGDGLVLRWSRPEDTERLAALYADVFRRSADVPPNSYIAAWTRDMMSGRHPLIDPTDFALVEDTRTGSIVATTCLLAQTWEYDGIPCSLGRPEVVGTAIGYRDRGLIRAIFELIHARSEARGDRAQGITGIPYYYRQFGYEYALDLGGNRALSFAAIPRLKDGAPEPYRLRDATAADIPLAQRLYNQSRASSLVSTRIDEPFWRWLFEGQSPESAENFRVALIVDATGRDVGYVFLGRWRYDSRVNVWDLGVDAGVSLVAALPSVLRAIEARKDSVLVSPNTAPADGIAFGLGRAHPVYDALGDLLPPPTKPPYPWYVRVPDLPGFMLHIAPALERRLASSVAAGYSGELTLDFYRDGLRLVFEAGRLVRSEGWRRGPWDEANAAFPPLVFLQLLFGYRRLDELRHAFPDVWARDEAIPLLRALFPSRRSLVLPIQ